MTENNINREIVITKEKLEKRLDEEYERGYARGYRKGCYETSDKINEAYKRDMWMHAFNELRHRNISPIAIRDFMRLSEEDMNKGESFYQERLLQEKLKTAEWAADEKMVEADYLDRDYL